MSDAPERIWVTHTLSVGYYFTAKGPQPRFYDVEYICADLHSAEIAALQGWRRVQRKALADGAAKRTEVLWLNWHEDRLI